MRHCPRLHSGMPPQGTCDIILTPISTSPVHPVMDEGQPNRGGDYLGRGHPRGGGQAGGAQPYCYTFPCRPEGESSDAVITSIILVSHRDALVLFDPGSTNSYMYSYLHCT